MRLFALVVVLLMSSLAPLRAQSPTPPADAMAAARELVAAARSTDQIKAVFPLIMQQMKPAVVQGRPEAEKVFDTVTPILLEGAYARMDELIDAIAVIYARNFSAGELRDITTFYKTPTGQKLLTQMPNVMQQSMMAGQQFAQSLAADLRQKMVDELRKRGIDPKN